jgi:hypothetical protein
MIQQKSLTMSLKYGSRLSMGQLLKKFHRIENDGPHLDIIIFLHRHRLALLTRMDDTVTRMDDTDLYEVHQDELAEHRCDTQQR